MKTTMIGLYIILAVEWLSARAATQIAVGACAGTGTGTGLIATSGIAGFAVGIGNSLGGFIIPAALSNQPTNLTSSNGITTSNDISSLSGFAQFTMSWWLKTLDQTSGIGMMAPSVEHVLLDKSSLNNQNNNNDATTITTTSLLTQNEYRFSIIEDMSRRIRQLKIYLGTNAQNIDYNSPNDASYQRWSFIWVVDLAPVSTDWQNIGVTWNGTVVTAYSNGTAIAYTHWPVPSPTNNHAPSPWIVDF